MKVSELIKLLQDSDPDSEAVIESMKYEYTNIMSVKIDNKYYDYTVVSCWGELD